MGRLPRWLQILAVGFFAGLVVGLMASNITGCLVSSLSMP